MRVCSHKSGGKGTEIGGRNLIDILDSYCRISGTVFNRKNERNCMKNTDVNSNFITINQFGVLEQYANFCYFSKFSKRREEQLYVKSEDIVENSIMLYETMV